MNLSSSIVRFMVRMSRPSPNSVLRSVNAARCALGIPVLDNLPAGQPCKYNDCPLSRALPGVVGVDGIAFAIPEQALAVAATWKTSVEVAKNGVYVARLPRKLRQFVRDFDLGGVPELEFGTKSVQHRTLRPASTPRNTGRRAA